jgi:8-oxo-dGTP pyrophosphatase MutT (NUDIX family)
MRLAARIPQPWRLLRKGAQRDYHIFVVREDCVADPRDGSEHNRAVIEAPNWVNVIPVTRDGRVVLIRQFRYGISANTLEIPGGTLEPGEDPGQAAARELEEETGFRAGGVEPLGFVHPNPAIQTNRCYSYLATGCERVHSGRQDAGEDIAVELFDRGAIPQLIRTGQITHAFVVAAFCLEQLRMSAPAG